MDFDILEAFLDKPKEEDVPTPLKERSDRSFSSDDDRRRSSRRSRSRSVSSRRGSPGRRSERRRDRSRDRSRYRSASRGKSRRYRSRSPNRPRRYTSRTPSPIRNQRKDEEARLSRLEREKRATEAEAHKMNEDAKRDDLTVLILNLALKATEKDIWEFLTENCGKVRDIQIIKDPRSNKSKGVAYVEFYTQDSVLRAYNLTGNAYILGQPIRIQASQAEKNRAAKVAKQHAAEILSADGPMKIYIGGLINDLASLGISELRSLFSPFGTITDVDYPTDPYTGKCKGYAFLTFSKASDARDAIQAMNGFEIANQQIKVGHANDEVGKNSSQMTSLERAHLQLYNSGNMNDPYANDPDIVTKLDDGDDTGLIHGEAKIALMRKLARDKIKLPDEPMPNVFRSDVIIQQASAQMPGHVAPPRPMIPQPVPETKNFVVYPLFSAKEIETEGIEVLDDIKEDVREECEAIGVVSNIHIDTNALDGRVYCRFAHKEGAVSAAAKLSGRSYSGNVIQLDWLSDQVWMQITGKPL